MSDQTSIEWTQASWNPWHGCVKVSPGCKLCYMYRDKARYGQDPTKVTRSKTTFNDPLKWREPRLIFTCSWSDFLIAEADGWRADAWGIIRRTPWHTYQILTKRPERFPLCLPADWGAGYPNVWLGVSVENQALADERIPLLLQMPAAVRFVSAEPLLGPVNLRSHFMSCERPADCECGHGHGFTRCPNYGGVAQACHRSDCRCERFRRVNGIHWAIVGGESGPGARPFNWMWADDLIKQCRGAGVSCFIKQLGSNPVGGMGDRIPLKDRKGGDWNEWMPGLRVREFPVTANASQALNTSARVSA